MRSGAWSCSRARSAAIWEGSVIVMSSLLGQSDRAELSGLATVIQRGSKAEGAPTGFSLISNCGPSEVCHLTSPSSSFPAVAERNETVTPMGASEPPRKKSVAAPHHSFERVPHAALAPGHHDLPPT